MLYFLGKDNRIPDVVARATRRFRPLTPTIVPSVQDAIQMYTNAGGVLTSECSFGNDPMADDGALRNRRDAEFVQNNPSSSHIFENVISLGMVPLLRPLSCHLLPSQDIYLHDHAHPSHTAI